MRRGSSFIRTRTAFSCWPNHSGQTSGVRWGGGNGKRPLNKFPGDKSLSQIGTPKGGARPNRRFEGLEDGPRSSPSFYNFECLFFSLLSQSTQLSGLLLTGSVRLSLPRTLKCI